MRRLATAVLASAALAGCGTVTVAGVRVNERQATWCAVHLYSFQKDIRHHRRGWALLQGALAAHDCTRAIS